LVADRREVDEVGPAPLGQAAVDDVGAAVDVHLVAAVAEPAGDLLGRRLEAGVGGGDAAGAEDGELHRQARVYAWMCLRALPSQVNSPARARPAAPRASRAAGSASSRRICSARAPASPGGK